MHSPAAPPPLLSPSPAAAPPDAGMNPDADSPADISSGRSAGAGVFARRTAFLGLRVSTVVALSAAVLVFVLLIVAIIAALLIRRRGRRNKSQVKHAAESPAPPPAGPPPVPAVTTAAESAASSGSNLMEMGMASLSLSSSSATTATSSSEARKMGWGQWYTFAELAAATNGFDDKNVIGEGGYGTVYRGVFPDGWVVAIKDLFDNKGQADKEFRVEVEAIGRVRHKNLVGLLGYCAEGSKRMLVYEYLENGSVEEWLHGETGRTNPLTWEARMKIAVGTAKGIAYLHEGLEPKVVHRDIKSSNILLDKQWNPKVSDFGMAKLLGPGSSFVATRVMGTFGYVAPEYASTGMLNESSDVYSFGVLLMELISGRSPVDYNRPAGGVNLVEWFKAAVGSRRIGELVDPSIADPPPPRALNRTVLVAFRCIDSDAVKRPKMGQIVHMLEGDEFPFRTEHRSPQSRRTMASSARQLETVLPGDSERAMCR